MRCRECGEREGLELSRDRKITYERICAPPQDALHLRAGIVYDHKVTVDDAEVGLVLEVVSIACDPTPDDRQESLDKGHDTLVGLFDLEREGRGVRLHIYPPHADVGRGDDGMRKLL